MSRRTTYPTPEDRRQRRGSGDDRIPAGAVLETTALVVSHGRQGGADEVWAGRTWRDVNGLTYGEVWPEAELTAAFDARGRLVRVDVRYPGDATRAGEG